MIFKRLLLKNYRKFNEKMILFGQGINVLFGNNEAGKSTITQAILDVLYIDPATQSKATLTKINSWGSEAPAYLELEMEDQGQTYLLIKDFAAKEATFINPQLHTETHDLPQIALVLNELIGLPTREIYKSTAFISHSDIAKIETNRDFINAVQNIAVDTKLDVNIQNILYDLEGELKQMRIGLDRHANDPGPLKATTDRISQLRTDITEKTELMKKSTDAMQMGKTTNAELDEVNFAIADLEKLLKNYAVFEKAEARIAELDLQINQMQSVLTNHLTLEAQKKAIRIDMEYYSTFIGQNLEAITAKLNNYLEVRKIANVELNKFAGIKKEGNPKAKYNFGQASIYYGIGLALSVLVYFVVNNVVIAAAFLLLSFAAISGVIYLQRKTLSATGSKQKSLIDDTIEQWKLKIHDSTTQIQKILDEFHCEDVGGFFANKAKFNMLNEEAREVDARIAGLLLNNKIADIQQKQVDLLHEKKEIEVNQLTEEVKRSKIPAHEYLIQSRELDTLKTKKKVLETQLTTALVKQEDSLVDSDKITFLQEELEQQELLLERLRQKDKVLQLTKDVLKQAINETAHTANQIIEASVEKVLPVLTQNRYDKIKIDDKFTLKVFSKEKKDWLDPLDNLSKGTVDQIYFLTRLGFLQMLLKNKSTPIICDDPFVTFDSGRKEALRSILQNLSQDFQILLFTCNHEYDEWGSVNKII